MSLPEKQRLSPVEFHFNRWWLRCLWGGGGRRILSRLLWIGLASIKPMSSSVLLVCVCVCYLCFPSPGPVGRSFRSSASSTSSGWYASSLCCILRIRVLAISEEFMIPGRRAGVDGAVRPSDGNPCNPPLSTTLSLVGQLISLSTSDKPFSNIFIEI